MKKKSDQENNQALLRITIARKEAESSPVQFINNFCFTFNPKLPQPHLRFRPFPFQVNLIDEVKKAIEEGYDIFIDKTREMGATYTVLDVLLWSGARALQFAEMCESQQARPSSN